MNRNIQHIIVGVLKRILIPMLVVSANVLHAQNYTLEECIDKALKQNASILINNNELKKSELQLAESKWNYAPTINANLNFNTTFGTAFDNVTFQRVQKTTHNSFPSLNLSMPVFEGFARVYQQKYYREITIAQQYLNKDQQNKIILEITSAYISILNLTENEKIYTNRIKAIENQLNRIQRQMDLGEKSQADVYAIKAQSEKEKIELLTVQNQLQKNKLLLSQLIQDENILKAQPAELNVELNITDSATLKTENQYLFLSRKFQSNAARYTGKMNLSGFFPKLYFNAAIASSYSSNGIFDFNTGQVTYPGYFSQLNQNTYQYIGFSLQVPLFNKFSNYYSYQRSLLDNKTALLNEEKTRQEITLEIQQLNADIRTASLKINSQKEQLNAATEAFKLAERNFESGAIDFYAYMNAMNARDQAASDVEKMNYEWFLIQKRVQLMQKK